MPRRKGGSVNRQSSVFTCVEKQTHSGMGVTPIQGTLDDTTGKRPFIPPPQCKALVPVDDCRSVPIGVCAMYYEKVDGSICQPPGFHVERYSNRCQSSVAVCSGYTDADGATPPPSTVLPALAPAAPYASSSYSPLSAPVYAPPDAAPPAGQ